VDTETEPKPRHVRLAGRTRIPNAQRSESTRAALLEATITAIARYGYRGASLEQIATMSGVTRGAQKHHFRNKHELVTQAVMHLQDKRVAEELERFSSAPPKSVREVLVWLYSTFTDDLYAASVELRVAARTDDALRQQLIPAEQEIGRRSRELLCRVLDDGRHSRETLISVGDMACGVLRDMAMQRMLYADDQRDDRRISALSTAVAAMLDSSRT
jgi:AcrR family transcriptional regulator